ncbi:MAG: formyltransferase family protein [bacterium]|nr:formyltransferase family protein [bacterium]
MTVLFLAKEKPFAKEAAGMLEKKIKDTDIIFGNIGDSFPEHVFDRQYDYVISYVSPWITPKKVLDDTKIAAINFHPGPPEYPGIGCTNFAIYDGVKEFGITVHHMFEKVDTGNIIFVKRFTVLENDTVYSLSQKCYVHIYNTFIEFLPLFVAQAILPKSGESWKRKPFTRKELNELCRVTKNMTDEEIRRRIRATSYPNMPGAFIELAGTKFVADID